jgi:hypothetical protein
LCIYSVISTNNANSWSFIQRMSAMALRRHCPVLYSNDIYVYIPFYCRE